MIPVLPVSGLPQTVEMAGAGSAICHHLE